MSDLGGVNMIHILCSAELAAAEDRANGTYEANIAADARYYMWQGGEQILPLGMDGNPEGFAAGLRAALPGVTTLRLSFNAYAFDETGALHPQYERFLAAAAAEGFQLVFTHADGGQQRLGDDRSLSSAEIAAALAEDVQPRALAAWGQMMDWLEAHPEVAAATWGFELANEPAAYERAVVLAAQGTKGAVEAQMVELYARHMAELAALVQDRAEGRILVGGWGYSAQFDDLAEEQVGHQSALDFLRAAIGEDLVWAAHLYPGWFADDTVSDAATYIAALERAYAPLGDDDILLTETSLAGDAINDFSGETVPTQWLSRMQEWFADKGIGTGWFSGAEAGASSLVAVDGDGDLRYLHQHSLAFALNAFSLDDAPADHAGDEQVALTLREAQLRNEDYDGGYAMDAVRQAGFGFGHGGNDTLRGAAAANNFLYGGTGRDDMQGAEAEDFLFGQDGGDRLAGNGGDDLLFGGRGADLLRGGSGSDTLEGGSGADRIDASAGQDLITDFDQAGGDRLYLGRGYSEWSDLAGRISRAAVNGSAMDDLVITHADGSTTTLLDAAGHFSAAGLVFAGITSRVDGSAGADLIAAGWEDMDGQVFAGAQVRAAAGDGADTVIGSARAEWLAGENGHDRLLGDAGSDTLQGGTGNDLLRGGTGHDVLVGGAGRDVLRGDDGQDILQGGAGQDRLLGGAGDDRLRAETGRDWLFGGEGDDHLNSGAERCVLRGGAGDDMLFANIRAAGQDLRGGSGADSFVFLGAGGGPDTRSVIRDFTLGEDHLLLGTRSLDLEDLPGSLRLREVEAGTLLILADGDAILLQDVFL
ncbi:MAG: hypothetical protein JNN06_16485 [Gemmobacter sp.]|uniref:calcium-binding protein n=1 Tax=Gemmobacter sp. TaxID=1898957 RepID=UPI001A61D9CC|nr:calcium-binding protein [Gemmobacter sp.]MBL8563867.1 hypothetical protein [Gemmobacter sp.]